MFFVSEFTILRTLLYCTGVYQRDWRFLCACVVGARPHDLRSHQLGYFSTSHVAPAWCVCNCLWVRVSSNIVCGWRTRRPGPGPGFLNLPSVRVQNDRSCGRICGRREINIRRVSVGGVPLLWLGAHRAVSRFGVAHPD